MKRLSPREVSEMFDISKSTLFRWESLCMIPKANKGADGNRQYSSEDVSEIALFRIEDIKKRLRDIEEIGTQPQAEELEDSFRRYQFLAGKIEGLYALVERGLTAESICRLLSEVIILYDPATDAFSEALIALSDAAKSLRSRLEEV